MSKMFSACGLEMIQVDDLNSAKAEMGEVKEENERLKMVLERVEKDHQSLQLHFFDILQKEASEKGVPDSTTSLDETEEPEPVSLCLGRSPREPKNGGNSSKPKKNENLEACLTLGLDTKSELSMEVVSHLSPMNGSEEPKEAEAEETWQTNKSVRAKYGDDDNSEQMPAKRARVYVRARCDTPMMNDGCQWRKYGQKKAKGNPCPRAYYRCTVAPACPVRKQVQRCAEDLSILITTYEGTHNHPLPASATAMASTTSAAVSTLLTGFSTSQPAGHSCSPCLGNFPTLLNGMNFNHFDQSRAEQVFLLNPAPSFFPAITLDLTSALSSSSNHVNLLPSCFASSPRFLGNRFPSTMPIDKTHIRPVNIRNQFQELCHQQYMKNQTPSQEALPETVTKAISTDSSPRSVIATVVSSTMGGGETSGSGLNLKLGKHRQFGYSRYFNRLSSSSSQTGNYMLLQPPLPFSIAKRNTPPSISGQMNH